MKYHEEGNIVFGRRADIILFNINLGIFVRGVINPKRFARAPMLE